MDSSGNSAAPPDHVFAVFNPGQQAVSTRVDT
jgi:hypothetical protein